MLDIGGGFTGSELQLEEVRSVLEVDTLLKKLKCLAFKLQLELIAEA